MTSDRTESGETTGEFSITDFAKDRTITIVCYIGLDVFSHVWVSHQRTVYCTGRFAERDAIDGGSGRDHWSRFLAVSFSGDRWDLDGSVR
jgi:hypothetical protein